MTQRLYDLYLHYDTKKGLNNEFFLELVSFFDGIIQILSQDFPKDERDDLRQEYFMIMDTIFRKKPIKMKANYYYKISEYKKKHLTTIVNWQEYYKEKIIYRNSIGFKIIHTYIYRSFNNKKKDLIKKKRPLLFLNRHDEKGIEYLEYIKSEETVRITIERLLIKNRALLSNRQLFIINCKLKHFRKKDSSNFRYITTSG